MWKLRRRQFFILPTETEVQRKFGCNAPIVLAKEGVVYGSKFERRLSKSLSKTGTILCVALSWSSRASHATGSCYRSNSSARDKIRVIHNEIIEICVAVRARLIEELEIKVAYAINVEARLECVISLAEGDAIDVLLSSFIRLSNSILGIRLADRDAVRS